MRFIPTVLALVAVVACDSDPFVPSVENMAGDYTATALMTSNTSGRVDWIGAGATFTIALSASGATAGRLFVPGGGPGGADLDEDMAGTWLLVGGTVRFGQTADTFVRNLDFVPTRDRLSADQTFADGTRFWIVLTK
jgi:hypothetical protein